MKKNKMTQCDTIQTLFQASDKQLLTPNSTKKLKKLMKKMLKKLNKKI
jgi:hypothetical protein